MRSILQHCGDYSESGPHAPFSLSHFRLCGARGRTWFRAPLFTTLLNCVRDVCRSAQQVGYFVSFRHATTLLGSGSLHGPGSAQGARDLAHLAFSLVHGPGRHTPATRFATRPSILVFSTRNRGAQFYTHVFSKCHEAGFIDLCVRNATRYTRNPLASTVSGSTLRNPL